jgi:tetratricopeptide (TPR) repeat protein
MDHARRQGLGEQEEAEAFFRRLGRHVRSGSPWEPGAERGEGSGPGTTDLPPGATVGRYRVMERIGAGGMGTVYRARDEALARDVALKLLPPHLATDPDAKARFLREARAVGALDHPNVCTVHEVGEAQDGGSYLAMALYRGETLKKRLARGPLPVEQAVAVAAGIARGLEAAHARGIVHRDVKPGNVFLPEDGGVKLLDFGLAKAADHTVTRPGVTPGTVAYMSPEQVEGGPVDLWSLGVVLYEMLTGVRPFRGEGDGTVLHAIAHRDPEAVEFLRPGTPEPVARAVARLLEKARENRYGSADELLTELEEPSLSGSGVGATGSGARGIRLAGAGRWLGAIAGVGTLAILGIWLGGPGGESPEAGDGVVGGQRVLVTDFVSHTEDPLLGDAVAQALRVELARAPSVRVVGAASLVQALGRMRRGPETRLDLPLARELAVREGIPAVIDGAVRRTGAGYLISAVLVEGASGEVIHGWRETSSDSSGILEAIDRLSRGIRAELGESLPQAPPGEELFLNTTASLDALRAYSQGNRIFFAGDYGRAGALYREAARHDSTFAMAHWMLAVTPPRSRQAFVTAYRWREGLPAIERYAVEGAYYWRVVGDLPRAIEAFRNQVEAAKPTGDVVLYAPLGGALAVAGDLLGAEAVLREAQEVYPTAVQQASLVEALYLQGKVREAAEALERAEALFPGHPLFRLTRARMAAVSGDHPLADSLARGVPLEVEAGGGGRLRAAIAAVEGRIGEAIELLTALQQELLLGGYRADATEAAVAVGRLHLVHGRPEAAVDHVEGFLAREPLVFLDPLDRPYLSLARFFARAGDPGRARGLTANYDREVPGELRGADRRDHFWTSALLSLAEGDPEAARAALELAGRAPPPGMASNGGLLRIQDGPEMALVHDRAGRPDSALAVLERFLAAPSLRRTELDGFELASALLRLGELHEERREPASAAHHYLRFAELWAGADPELLPRVEEARRRAALLRALEGGPEVSH